MESQQLSNYSPISQFQQKSCCQEVTGLGKAWSYIPFPIKFRFFSHLLIYYAAKKKNIAKQTVYPVTSTINRFQHTMGVWPSGLRRQI